MGVESGKGLLIGEQGGLRNQNCQILIDAGFVARLRQFEVTLRGLHGLLLLLNFFGQDAHGGEIVFHLLESGENGLAVAGEVGVVGGDKLLHGGAAQAGIKNGFRYRRADAPEVAGPVENL